MNPVATDRPRRTRHAVSLVITLAALCLATACSRPVREVLFPDPAFQRFSATGAEPLATKWWTTFGDEKLNALMDRALSGNFSLMTAWDRLEQERATTASAGADQWPTLDATADASRTRTVSKLQTAGGGSQKTVTYTNSFTGTLVASYEVDLWGGVRSTLEAARRDVMAAEYDVQAAAITLTGEIATAWYELVELRGELRLLDKQKETNEKQLEIITLKFRRGHASATDVLQQRQVLEALQGRRRLVEATIAERRNRIAVLVGAVPGSIEIDTPTNSRASLPFPQRDWPPNGSGADPTSARPKRASRRRISASALPSPTAFPVSVSRSPQRLRPKKSATFSTTGPPPSRPTSPRPSSTEANVVLKSGAPAPSSRSICTTTRRRFSQASKMWKRLSRRKRGRPSTSPASTSSWPSLAKRRNRRFRTTSRAQWNLRDT